MHGCLVGSAQQQTGSIAEEEGTLGPAPAEQGPEGTAEPTLLFTSPPSKTGSQAGLHLNRGVSPCKVFNEKACSSGKITKEAVLP